jgi:hypothetical protein
MKKESKIDSEKLELILQELDDVVNIVKSAQYPVCLDSAWLCVVSLDPLRAFVIPLAEGACDTKIVQARETEVYKQYKKLFIGENQTTAASFLKLKHRGFKTPLVFSQQKMCTASSELCFHFALRSSYFIYRLRSPVLSQSVLRQNGKWVGLRGGEWV